MTRKLYELTDEHRAQFGPWEAKWRKNILRTAPRTESERKRLRSALRGMYRAAKLKPAEIEVFSAGPISSALAACIASAVWWLRENLGEHQKLFGHVLSEA